MIEAEVRSKGLKEAQRKFRLFHMAIKQGRVEPMKAGAEKAVDIILKRTVKGLDVNHKAFKPYTPKYAKRKKSTQVNLILENDMLAAIDSQSWAKKSRIFIKKGLQWVKGKTHNVGGRSGRGTGFAMPKREFMGVERERAQIVAVIRKWWQKYKRQVGL